MNYRVFFYTFLFLAIFSISGTVSASSYTVAPLVLNETLKPRDIVERTVTITNSAPHMVTIYPSINNISLDAGGTMVPFVTPVMSDRLTSLSSWIEFSRKGIDIKAGETYELPITFRIHPEPREGTYHAFLGFGTGDNRDEAEGLVARGDAPGIIITVTIADIRTTFIRLKNFIVERFVTSDTDDNASYAFHNTGDEAVTPQGEIIFYDSRGMEVGATTINPNRETIMPGAEHTFVSEVPTEGLFGRYKGFLSVTYGTDELATVHDTVFFYVFPMQKILIGIAVVVVLSGVLAWYLHRRYFDSEEVDDSDTLTMRVRTEKSEPKDHDINLKQK